ncbi:MAG: transglycosylase SLT domain-containing protein [Synergistales bacterium]|nr:transglycosylase SLT domain-containing protein [Synergistales bacterium]
MNSSLHRIFLVFLVSIIMGVLFLPGTGFGEGQEIISLHHMTVKASQEKETLFRETALDLKQKVMAEKFKNVNSKLEDYEAHKFSEYVLEASRTFGIDPFLIASIMIKESNLRYKARSRSAAYGLMQINWKVHRENIRKTFSQVRDLPDIIQPRNNILVGTYIFSSYLNSSKGDVTKALSRYLGSSGKKYIAGVLKHHQDMSKAYSSRIRGVTKEKVS